MSGLRADVRTGVGGLRLSAAFEVPPGTVLAVLGPNGAGKTTLLRTLAGLHPLVAGHVTLDGDVLEDTGSDRRVPAPDRRLGVVFQDYRLFPHLSVLDNVAFAARARGAGRAAAQRTAAAWVERLGLTPFADRRPGGLSGGQAQRVALARALASEPRLLLLDEPLAALDAATRLDVRALLRAHLRDFGGPALVVTHDPLEALVLADRVLVLEGGRVVQAGAPADVARRPGTAYVARLVGLNLVRGTPEAAPEANGKDGKDATGGLRTADGAFVPARLPAGRATTDGPLLAAIPPSAVTLAAGPPDAAPGRTVWTATVTGLELHTDRVRVSLDGAPVTTADLEPARLPGVDLSPGRPVWVTVDPAAVDVYPPPAPA